MGCGNSSMRGAPPAALRGGGGKPQLKRTVEIVASSAAAKAAVLETRALSAKTASGRGAGPPPAEDNGTWVLRVQAEERLVASDPRFETVLHMAKVTFQVERAALSLLGTDGQLEAVAGIGSEGAAWAEFGVWVLADEHPIVMVVDDAMADARFCDNPLLSGGPHPTCFYAGAPLVGSTGKLLGVLGIADSQPRLHVPGEQRVILANFAAVCVQILEEQEEAGAAAQGQSVQVEPEGPPEPRLPSRQQQPMALQHAESLKLPEHLQQAQLASSAGTARLGQHPAPILEAAMLCDCATDTWVLKWVDPSFVAATGVQQDEATASDFWSLFRLSGAQGEGQDEAEGEEEVMSDCFAAIFCKQRFSVTVASRHRPSLRLLVKFRPAKHCMPLKGALQAIASELLAGEDLYIATLAPAAQPVATPAGSATSADLRPSGPSFTISPLSPDSLRSVSFSTPPGHAYASPECQGLKGSCRLFDQVTLGPLLGAGAYGRVYAGIWRGSEVAVKVMDYYCPPIEAVIQLSAQKHSGLLEALLGREYSRHPNLVQTYDWDLKLMQPADPNRPGAPVRHALWLVLQMCNRGSLYDAVLKGKFRHTTADGGGLPNMHSILVTAREIAGAMSLLHDAGIIHGDLSASNVLLSAAANSRRFTVAVSDFGLSRMCSELEGKKTDTVGTVTHQPPELLRDGHLSTAADVYAFGVLLWSMYCGKHPYHGESPFSVIARVAGSSTCPLHLPKQAPPGFQNLFQSCVSYERTERPSFHEVLSLLAPLVEQAEQEAAALVAPFSPSSPRSPQSHVSPFCAV